MIQNNNYNTLIPSSNTQQEVYNKLMEIRNMPLNTYRTVFNDISDEWLNCAEEERKFIEQDEEYQQSNIEYAQQFNAFLLDQFGLQFANSKYGVSAEKVLLAMRQARKKYKTVAVEDLNKIIIENAALQKQLKELEELINATK